jgi:hypothetical protein
MLILQNVGLVYYLKLLGVAIILESTPWASQLVFAHVLLSCFLVGALPLLALMHLGYVHDAGYHTFFEHFDLLAALEPNWKQSLGVIRVLFGHSIWRSHFMYVFCL